MSTEFQFDVLLSHSAKDKAVVRPLAERLRADGLKVWFDEWEFPSPTGAGEGGRRSGEGFMSAHAFGSHWAQFPLPNLQPLPLNPQPTCDPLNQERRFIPLRLDDAPIKGSPAQFHCVHRVRTAIHYSRWN